MLRPEPGGTEEMDGAIMTEGKEGFGAEVFESMFAAFRCSIFDEDVFSILVSAGFTVSITFADVCTFCF